MHERGDDRVDLGRLLQHREVTGAVDDLQHRARDVGGEVLPVLQRREAVVVAADHERGEADRVQAIHHVEPVARVEIGEEGGGPVSYTHLTLPTIYSV